MTIVSPRFCVTTLTTSGRNDLCQLSEEDVKYDRKINRAPTLAKDVFRSLSMILKRQPKVMADAMAQKSAEKKAMNYQGSLSQQPLGILALVSQDL